MKETYYFPHDYNATQDVKMLALLHKCGLEGIGAYWIIVEILHQQPDGKITLEVFHSVIDMHTSDSSHSPEACSYICSTLVSTGLLQKDENYVWSDRVMSNKKHREAVSKQRSYAGKTSAKKRFGTNVQRPLEQVLNNIKERKGKERKEIKEISTYDGFIKTLKDMPVYKKLDIDRELAKMDAWLIANPRRKKTKGFILYWLNKELDKVGYEVKEPEGRYREL